MEGYCRCGRKTQWACSDCHIDTGKTVWVCPITSCRQEHEAQVCSRTHKMNYVPKLTTSISNSNYCPASLFTKSEQ
jgi:hypothetical protein